VIFPRVASHDVAVVIIAWVLVPAPDLVPPPDLALSSTSSILMYLLERGDCRVSVSDLRFIVSISAIVLETWLYVEFVP